MSALPPYASTGQRVWFYSFRVICGLIFFFLIFPILVIVPLSFNAEDFFTFTKAMLAFEPAGYSLKHYQDFFTNPDWQQALTNSFLIAPVAFILVAENLGHIKAIGGMTKQNMDRYIGRGFVGDGLATMLAGSGGGTGVTTYVENMGVMAVTRVFSTLIFVIAAAIAILLGFSPKFGALLHTIPGPVLGGLGVAVFGLIAAAMVRLWVDNQVDFSDPRNLFTVGITLIFGGGDFTVTFGGFAIGGIGTATLAAIILYQVLSIGRENKDAITD